MKWIGTGWAREELSAALLPDKRYQENLIAMGERLSEKVGHSFSSACGERLRKSAWRLFSHTGWDLQAGHRQKTKERLANQSVILILEDTTDINYSAHPSTRGLGRLGGNEQTLGLNLHTALAVSASGEPLGIVGQWAFSPYSGRKQGELHRDKVPIEQKESYKWIKILDKSAEVVSDFTGEVILVADREADFYEHYTHPRAAPVRLLVRVQQRKRKVIHQGQATTIAQALESLSPVGGGRVAITKQANRAARTACVLFYATSITLPATTGRKGQPRLMNIVQVKEVNPPDQAAALEWVLLTDLPVDNLAQVSQAVSYYAQRWLIERFHYVLKQGCRVESLQFDEAIRLENALQLYSLVAWQLLWMYKIAASDPLALASCYFQQEILEVFHTITHKEITTVKDFILALASVSGFKPTKKQPYPGEKLLWQATRWLLAYQAGFEAARQKYGTG